MVESFDVRNEHSTKLHCSEILLKLVSANNMTLFTSTNFYQTEFQSVKVLAIILINRGADKTLARTD